jgi:hypothetical protein
VTDRRRLAAGFIGGVVAAFLLVAAIDLHTNSIDTARFSWDFRYYISIAEHGFGGELASPFAYRFITPLLAGWFAAALRLPVVEGFRLLAWFGAISQLLAVFTLTRWFTGSLRGAWVAMLATSFSLWNVKFLLFDVYRPDHLAYPLILLQSYWALTGKFRPLLISTLIGCQVREFNAIPLVAYIFVTLRLLDETTSASQRRKAVTESAASAVGLALALLIPRIVIPVAEDFQFASLTPDGILRSLLAPLILVRDANFAFSAIAFALPALMLGGPGAWRAALAGLRRRDRLFLVAYSTLVLILSFLGGTDFFRFMTYLLVPQALVLGILAKSASNALVGIVLFSSFVFNRMWAAFPMSDVEAYRDFYGGFGTRFNSASVKRLLECAAFVLIGAGSRRLLHARAANAESAGR